MPFAASPGVQTDTYNGECRRDFFRVSSRLAIRLTWLTEAEAEELTRELGIPCTESVSLTDKLLEARLTRIENKLDLILKQTGFDVELALSQTEKRAVELSGSGVRLHAPEIYRVGDLVKIQLDLPEECGRTLILLGRVVLGNEVGSVGASSGVALVFHSIRNRDREAIVRHAYEVQRLMLDRTANRSDLR
ncbi:MAG: PilZ domain-containing protein [Myxococcales bacterium]|nr:PilZ domain-containing protein [Myxococcales bacterium]